MNEKSHHSDVYDLALATGIAGGNPRIAAELLALLLKELPAQREALDHAFATDDLKKLREINHKLYGSARYCGTPALMNATRDLENNLADAPREVIARAFDRVLREINRLLDLRPVLASPPE